MKKNKLTAVIPVRKGSQRVKNKNLKPFAGSTLLDIKIETLKKVIGLDEIVVTSDSQEMLDIARKHNVTAHKREDYYASSEVNNSDFMVNLTTAVDSEYIMYSPCTSPLLSNETISECISKFRAGAQNIVTVTSQKHHMWLDGEPLNYNPSESPNSQDLPDIYSVNYGCCIISCEDLHEFRNVVTNNPTFHVTDEIESIDIDTEFDFMMAEFVYRNLNE
tara:strand:- start:178 stop:834 length:657 start_codon:yes stop_codon:yes gene_type:complete